MSNLLEFRDKMDMYDKESLKIFARDLYMGKTSQLKKADLIEKIAENFLSKESLFNRLAILDEASLLLLGKAYIPMIHVLAVPVKSLRNAAEETEADDKHVCLYF